MTEVAPYTPVTFTYLSEVLPQIRYVRGVNCNSRTIVQVIGLSSPEARDAICIDCADMAELETAMQLMVEAQSPAVVVVEPATFATLVNCEFPIGSRLFSNVVASMILTSLLDCGIAA